MNLKRNKKAFTIIELLIVIAIIGILVLLATPKFLGYVEKAELTRIQHDVKVAESVVGVELVYSGNLSKWGSPVSVDLEKSKSENKLYDTRGYVTGPIENGPYWKIDQSEFNSKLEGNFYANQGGKAYYEEGEFGNTGEPEEPALPGDNTPVATDKDFTWTPGGVEGREEYSYEVANEDGPGFYQYTGSAKEVKIPHTINGNPITNYYMMFSRTHVTKVVSDNPNVTNMSYMFSEAHMGIPLYLGEQVTSLDLSSFDTSGVIKMEGMFVNSYVTSIIGLNKFDTSGVTNMEDMFKNSKATELDLSNFKTSNVTNMEGMFAYSQAIELDLSSFNTSGVTDMKNMFRDSRATSLDLSSFDTLGVTNMSWMFAYSHATSLDLSSFDTSGVTDMDYMFYDSLATKGYAKTENDANKLNSSSDKPGGLTFEVK